MEQLIINGIEHFPDLLNKVDCKRFLLVCDRSFSLISIKDNIIGSGYPYVIFNDFTSNPLHEDADKGIDALKQNDCNVIVAVGGGSSLDVAKCIKLDSGLDLPLIAIPTTAGTGSESTKHIVVYKDGKKESLGNDNVIPNIVILEPFVLSTLPESQKYSTMLDALCQGIESYWSVNATPKTRLLYSKPAIERVVRFYREYLGHKYNSVVAEAMMYAANFSGKAINITQTTAAHAMSYKLTSKYNIPHGNAAALCLIQVWIQMNNKVNSGDSKYTELKQTFDEIVTAMKLNSVDDAINDLHSVVYGSKWVMIPKAKKADYDNDIAELTSSVNPIRLKNNPIQFTPEEIEAMYRNVVTVEE